jgi:hypothetical protein
MEYSISYPYAHKFIVLRCGIPFVFLKYTIKEYNPSMHKFNVAIVDCSYSFGYHHQAAYQKYKEEIITRVVSGRDLGLTKVITYKGISGHL